MGNELANSGFGDVAAKLRERIQAAFVDLIPEDRWNAMLQAEVEKFLHPIEDRDHYNGRVTHRPSPFSKLCNETLSELVGAEVKARYEASNKAELQTTVSEWLDKNHQAVLRTFIQELVANCTSIMVDSLKFNITRAIEERFRR